MAGQTLFKKAEIIITVISSFLKILPVPFRELFWHFSFLFPRTLGAGIRYCIARTLVASLGKNVYFGGFTVIKNWSSLSIGNNVSIHEFCYIDALGGIEIKDNVSIAHGVSLISFDHSWSDISMPIKYNPVNMAPIRICSDVWIGCGAKILKDVRVGPRTVIGAGAVVVKDAPESSLLCGIPARQIKRL